jgi:hypothetical protein
MACWSACACARSRALGWLIRRPCCPHAASRPRSRQGCGAGCGEGAFATHGLGLVRVILSSVGGAGRSGSSCGAPRRGSAPEPVREGRRRRLHRLVPRRRARRRVYHQRRDNPAGTAAGQEAPQEAAEPATAPGLAGDRCGRRASADRRDHGACCPGRNQPAARTEGGTDRDGQRAGAAADRDGHSAPARPDYHRHAAAAGPDHHHSVSAPWPALRRCIACPAPARSTRLNRDRRGNWRDSAGRGSRQPRPVRQPGRDSAGKIGAGHRVLSERITAVAKQVAVPDPRPRGTGVRPGRDDATTGTPVC